MTGLEPLTIVLRALVYAGSIGVAGGALFALGFPRAAPFVAGALKRQIIVGFLLLLAVEPLRYVVFQLAIADGDVALAFGPELRAMGLETPLGQAILVRLAAAIVVVAATFLRMRIVGTIGALGVIGSFLIEGHTAASEIQAWIAPLLVVHLAAVTWWLGALLPLIGMTRMGDQAQVVALVEAFGRRALWIVALLVAAGVVLAAALTGANLDPSSPYQQRLVIKLALVAALLSIAAVNKLRLTPLLTTDFERGARLLRTSIRIEVGVALAVLAATAWLTATAPDS